MDGLGAWLQGLVGWIIAQIQGATEWLVSSLQNSWPWMVDTFGALVQNPEPVAIGLTVAVFVVLFGLLIGRALFQRIDRQSTDDTDDVDDVDDVEDEDDELRNPYKHRLTVPGDDL